MILNNLKNGTDEILRLCRYLCDFVNETVLTENFATSTIISVKLGCKAFDP